MSLVKHFLTSPGSGHSRRSFFEGIGTVHDQFFVKTARKECVEKQPDVFLDHNFIMLSNHILVYWPTSVITPFSKHQFFSMIRIQRPTSSTEYCVLEIVYFVLSILLPCRFAELKQLTKKANLAQCLKTSSENQIQQELYIESFSKTELNQPQSPENVMITCYNLFYFSVLDSLSQG